MSAETSLDGAEPSSKQPRIHYASYTQYEAIPFKDDPKIKEVLLQQKVIVQFHEQKPETMVSNIIDPTLSPNVVSELNQEDLDSPFLFYDNQLTSGLFLNSNSSELHTNLHQIAGHLVSNSNVDLDSNSVQQFTDESTSNLEQQNIVNTPETIYVKQEQQDYFEDECQDYDRLDQNDDNFLNVKQDILHNMCGVDQMCGNQKILFQEEGHNGRICDKKQEKFEDSNNGLEQCNDEVNIINLRTEESLGDSDDNNCEKICRNRKQKIVLKQDDCEIGTQKKMGKKLNLVKKKPEVSKNSECSGNSMKKIKMDKSDKKGLGAKSKEVVSRKCISDDLVQCYRCNVQDIPRKNLMDHVRKTHNKFRAEASSEVDAFFKSLADSNDQLDDYFLYCELCVEYFPSLIHLTVHVEMKHGICRWCELRFNPKKDIDHRLKHRFIKPYLYKCKCCNEEFITVLDFVSLDHQVKHTLPENSNGCTRMDRVRDFECPYCIFQTKNDKILKFHLQLHELSKCVTCKHLYLPTSKHIADFDFQKCLACSPKLECLYESTNSSIKLFHCLFCDYTSEDGIKIHDHAISCHQYCSKCCAIHPKKMTKKHGDFCENFRHYKCDACKKIFKTDSDYREHLKVNERSSQCWFTQEKVSIKSDLVVDKILSNTQCPYCLIYMGNVTGDFEIHLKKVHGFKLCSKCSKLIQYSNVCIKCPTKKLGNWEKIDKITLERKELWSRYKK